MTNEHDPEKAARDAAATHETASEPTKPLPAKLNIPKLSLEGAPLSQYTTNEDADYPEQLKEAPTAHFCNEDLEAATPRPSNDCRTPCRAKRTTTRDSMWPEREHLVAAHKLRKKARGCYPWRNLNRRQKLIAKILIALLIIGIGVAIGITVSIAVGGHYYKNQTNSPVVQGNLS